MFLKNDNCARKDSLLSVKIDLRLIKVFLQIYFYVVFRERGLRKRVMYNQLHTYMYLRLPGFGQTDHKKYCICTPL